MGLTMAIPVTSVLFLAWAVFKSENLFNNEKGLMSPGFSEWLHERMEAGEDKEEPF